MSVIRPTVFTLVAALALTGPVPLIAQSDEDEQDETDDRQGVSEPGGEPSTAAPTRKGSVAVAPTATTPATTKTVVASIQSATRYCKLVQPNEYVIDCLAERLDDLSKQLQGQEGFEEVRAVLETTSNELNDIARQNRSDSLAPATFSTKGPSPVRTSRRLVPVDDAKLDVAVSQALAVIGEAETLLLRSAEQSADRAIQFQQIAAAIGSNKVLLRSI